MTSLSANEGTDKVSSELEVQRPAAYGKYAPYLVHFSLIAKRVTFCYSGVNYRKRFGSMLCALLEEVTVFGFKK